MRKIIAVVGDALVGNDEHKMKTAYETGKAIVDNGFRLQCGGLNGVMLWACRGARDSKKYREGDVIGILPSFDVSEVNKYVDIAIPTGMDIYRNVIVANASAVVAVGGGAGTLCEIASAWALGRLIVAYENVNGWSSKVAGTCMDGRKRYPFEDKIWAVSTPEDMIATVNKYIDKYNKYHKGIMSLGEKEE